MTSFRQNEANRANSKRSTGPKTASGKEKSSKNSQRHGLSKSVDDGHLIESRSAALMEQVKAQDLRIDSSNVTRAKIELNRIREIRLKMIVAFLESPDSRKSKNLRSLQRYEQQAFARQKRALTPL